MHFIALEVELAASWIPAFAGKTVMGMIAESYPARAVIFKSSARITSIQHSIPSFHASRAIALAMAGGETWNPALVGVGCGIKAGFQIARDRAGVWHDDLMELMAR